jgi:hypothetical protein
VTYSYKSSLGYGVKMVEKNEELFAIIVPKCVCHVFVFEKQEVKSELYYKRVLPCGGDCSYFE